MCNVTIVNYYFINRSTTYPTPRKARPYTTHPTPRKAPPYTMHTPNHSQGNPNTTRPTSRRAPPYTTYSLRSYYHFEITGNSVLDLISK